MLTIRLRAARVAGWETTRSSLMRFDAALLWSDNGSSFFSLKGWDNIAQGNALGNDQKHAAV